VKVHVKPIKSNYLNLLVTL